MSHDAIIAPLQNFLDGEMRNIMKVKKWSKLLINFLIQ